MAIREERKRSLKPLLFLVLWGGLIFTGAKAFPICSGSSKLADYIRDLAVHASMQKTSPTEIQAQIVQYARSVGFPIAPTEVRVTRTEDAVQIKLDYTAPVRLGVFTWNLHFTPSAESRAYN